MQEPDEQARGIVQLVFDKFEELGTVWRVFCYFKRNKIQFGYRCLRGPKRGQLEWRRPTRNSHSWRYCVIRFTPEPTPTDSTDPVARIPFPVRSKEARWFLSPDEIRVLIQGRVPAYIGWEQYLANQRR